VEGLNGNVIPVKDIEALYLSMEKNLNFGGDLVKMAENARRMVCDRYDRNILLNVLKEEYDLLINRNKE
jgi:hypothetical protein